MTAAPLTRLGFVAPGKGWSSHYDEFLALMPSQIQAQIVGLDLGHTSWEQLAGRADLHVEKTAELAKERDWQAVAAFGAPMEAYNAGFADQLRKRLTVPSTTALQAGAAAVRALGARKALLLTPFDEGLKQMIKENLESKGLEPILPVGAFASIQDARQVTPDEVYEIARDRLRNAPGAEAIYFQGAVLNPLAVIELIEENLGIPVVASNPAMLWHLTSMTGLRFSVLAMGRLLREWPHPVEA